MENVIMIYNNYISTQIIHDEGWNTYSKIAYLPYFLNNLYKNTTGR